MASEASAENRTALIFGASGITGWAVMREALRYPSPVAFKQVIGLTNRPLDRSKLLLPSDDRLTLASGIDLTKNIAEVAAKLDTINGIGDVTDVFFAGELAHEGLLEGTD
jgi:hypothetical protein